MDTGKAGKDTGEGGGAGEGGAQNVRKEGRGHRRGRETR